jgi:hypothetical protein
MTSSTVTAGKTRDRHNHAAIFAAAGRTWSVPHRRGEIWVQAAGPMNCRMKLFVLEPRVSVPKYWFSGGQLAELNSLIIHVVLKQQGLGCKRPPKTSG